MTTATYTKLNDGTWGIRVNGKVASGAQVVVSKRDGSSETKTVAAVIWSGIAKDGKEASLVTVATGGSRSAPRRSGRGAGAAASVPGYSSYCTDRAGCRCYDCA